MVDRKTFCPWAMAGAMTKDGTRYFSVPNRSFRRLDGQARFENNNNSLV
jgi:hypothetical protein